MDRFSAKAIDREKLLEYLLAFNKSCNNVEFISPNHRDNHNFKSIDVVIKKDETKCLKAIFVMLLHNGLIKKQIKRTFIDGLVLSKLIICLNQEIHDQFFALLLFYRALQSITPRYSRSIPEDETDFNWVWIKPLLKKARKLYRNLTPLKKDKPGTLKFVHDKSKSFTTLQLKSSYEKKTSYFFIILLEEFLKALCEENPSEKFQINLSNPKLPLVEIKDNLDFNNNRIEKWNQRKSKKQKTLKTEEKAVDETVHKTKTTVRPDSATLPCKKKSTKNKSETSKKNDNKQKSICKQKNKSGVKSQNQKKSKKPENASEKKELQLKTLKKPLINSSGQNARKYKSYFNKIGAVRNWFLDFALSSLVILSNIRWSKPEWRNAAIAVEKQNSIENLSVKEEIDQCFHSFWNTNLNFFLKKRCSFRSQAYSFLRNFIKKMSRRVEHFDKNHQENHYVLEKKGQIFASFGFVAKATYAQFEKWIKFLLSSSHKALLVTCFFLNEENKGYLEIYSKDLQKTISFKRDILEQLLLKEIKEKHNNKEKLMFILECAEELKSLDLLFNLKEFCESNKKTLNIFETNDGDTSNDDLFADAVKRVQARDPPGQRSVYIPPGDTNREAYRLSTFLKFPTDTPVSPRRLAAIGFIYMGYKDWVKCFSCGSTVHTWVYGDDETSAQWHEEGCLMVLDRDVENVPLGSEFFGNSRFRRFGRNRNLQSNQTPPHKSEPIPPSPRQATSPRAPASAELSEPPPERPSTASNHQPPLRQTATVVQRTAPTTGTIELATIPSVHHESLIRSLNLESERDRLKTFSPWPANLQTVIPSNLARWGFFYLGNSDRVQCFSCGGVLRNWNYGDNVEREHRRHFANCRFLSGDDNRNIPLPESERPVIPPINRIQPPPDPSPSEQRNLENMFPCLYPASAHMRSEEQRFETFDDRWQTNVIHATPREIAQAGFFFLGDRDRVKCWYCNGGLQNWDPEDEPWTEHAKWFPTCEYLLRSKGPDFAHRIVALYPNLPRPRLQGAFDVPPGGYTQPRRPPSPPPPIIDPKIETQRVQTSVNQAMNSEIAQNAKEMGYEERTIRQVLKRRFESENSMYDSTTAFIEDLLAFDEELQSENEEENEPETSQATSSGQENQTNALLQSGFSMPEGTTPSMEARVRELIDERKCKICLDKPADIVFVPCGHLCCCASCAPALRKCPICRVKIAKAIKTYVS